MKQTTFSHTFGTFFTALKRNIDAPLFVTKQSNGYLAEFRTNKARHCLRLDSFADYQAFSNRIENIQKPFFKLGF